MVLILLQDSWSEYWAGFEWQHDPWLKSLLMGKSGQKIKTFLPIKNDEEIRDGKRFWIDTTTPMCGPTADSAAKPDVSCVMRLLKEHKPTLVVACGKQAQGVITEIVGHCHNYRFSRIYMPHPATRMLSRKCCNVVRDCVEYHVTEIRVNGHLRSGPPPFHLQYDPRGVQTEIKT